jgi:hypothetical protein
MKIMEKKSYLKPEVLIVKVDCDIVMQTQSDPVTDPIAPDPGGEEPVTSGGGFFNPFKWFK